ncbi:MAG: glutamate--tRNA ligase [Candidatus Wallbacteria bacterium]
MSDNNSNGNLQNKVVTRFAPSPTGFLHIGGARTALFNYLFAKHFGGKFILRIEDTDMQRNSEEATEAILKSMKWLGLDWDEGPYYQSKRFDIYSRYAEEMIDKGLAYRCFCTPERLDAMRKEQQEKGLAPKYDGKCQPLSKDEVKKRLDSGEKSVVRFKMPAGQSVSFKDMVHGEVSFQSDVLDDFVIMKSDCAPTYNFAVAIDDHEMGMTHIIRGDDHISNTPKQILILNALGFNVPLYGHVPMILGADKTKLSKRHGATSLTWYEEAGYIKEAIVNYLALLGWSLDGSSEFFTKKDLIEKFTVEKTSSNAAVFDLQRLAHFNGYYLKNMEMNAKIKLVMDYTADFLKDMKIETKYFTAEYVQKIIEATGDRLKILTDFQTYGQPFLTDEIEIKEDAAAKIKKDFNADSFKQAIEAIINIFKITDFQPAELEAKLRAAQSETGINFSKTVLLLRTALTGQTVSTGIFDVVIILGKERVLERLNNFSGKLTF